MSRALVAARERWKWGVFADSALVSAGQRRWAMIQVLLQLCIDIGNHPPAAVRILTRNVSS
jgi:hypothetical protein